MASVALTREQHRRLVRLIAQRAGILTPLQRENLLEQAGLYEVVPDLNLDAPARDFAQQLVRVLQDRVGTLAETGQPALVSLLREVRAIVAGHEEESAFLDELLAPYGSPPVRMPPSPIPTVSVPAGAPPVAEPPMHPLPTDPAFDACVAEAERRAKRFLILIVALVGGLSLSVLLLGIFWLTWEVMEPVWTVLTLVAAMVGYLYLAITLQELSPLAFYRVLVEREQRQLGCAEPATPLASQRAAELVFLAARERAIQADRRVRPDKYVEAAGEGEVAEIRQEYEIVPLDLPEEMEPLREEAAREAWQRAQRKHTTYTSIFHAVAEIPQAALLGEPGSGKTAALRKLEVEAIARARQDEHAPIPLYLPLREWLDENQSLEAFMAAQAGTLSPYLDTLLADNRLTLLLDGLNEVPAAQRAAKARQVERLFKDVPRSRALVSCREQDYPRQELTLDWIVVRPLDPLRIRDFARRYLGEELGERLFWEVAGGGQAQEQYDAFVAWYGEEQPPRGFARWLRGRDRRYTAQRKAEADRLFWLASTLPAGNTWGFHNWNWERWVAQRDEAGSLLALARNPYMLLLMVAVFAEGGALPPNRGQLFDRFVRTLLVRESELLGEDQQLARRTEHEVILLAPSQRLLTKLARLAYEMQLHRVQGGTQASAVVALPRSEALGHLGDDGRDVLRLGLAANLLGSLEPVSFGHQLLQEYFAARYMQRELAHLPAERLWPPVRWWERTGWEETVVLLAGLHSDDCTPVLEWVQEANPEVAAQCTRRSGAHTPPETRERLRAAWLPRLADVQREPHPYGRAAVGRALAIAGLDDRPGVGVGADGVPDIDWVALEGGEFIYQNGQTQEVEGFSISRYPVTNWQWEAFLGADDGYHNARWWRGLAGDQQEPAEPRWSYGNHPRENVNWYEAMAFCRWLTARLGLAERVEDFGEHSRAVVRLPTEEEWERAARGRDGRAYPWGPKYESGRANIDETDRLFNREAVGEYYLQQTSAVGMYPQGETPEGIHDLSGNVWEWTLTEYGSGGVDITTSTGRVLRGGSWNLNHRSARAASRDGSPPRFRYVSLGFRVVLASPLRSEI